MLFYRPDNVTNFFRNTAKYHALNVRVPPDVRCPEKSVSVVTTCMDRLHDLKVTLPKNLADNAGYGPLEFVLLDYNSRDGLGGWVRSEMGGHLESGRLVYYRTEEPEYFCPNHSRNVSFRLARNELVANVDTDNFTHPGYVARLNQCATASARRLLVVPENFLVPGDKRLLLKGRFALYKRDIEFLRGFDEDLDEGFGSDDLNFVFRAMFARFTISRYESFYADGRLPTTDGQRVSLVRNTDYRAMLEKNGEITRDKLSRGLLEANPGRPWGRANLTRNFKEAVET